MASRWGGTGRPQDNAVPPYRLADSGPSMGNRAKGLLCSSSTGP